MNFDNFYTKWMALLNSKRKKRKGENRSQLTNDVDDQAKHLFDYFV